MPSNFSVAAVEPSTFFAARVPVDIALTGECQQPDGSIVLLKLTPGFPGCGFTGTTKEVTVKENKFSTSMELKFPTEDSIPPATWFSIICLGKESGKLIGNSKIEIKCKRAQRTAISSGETPFVLDTSEKQERNRGKKIKNTSDCVAMHRHCFNQTVEQGKISVHQSGDEITEYLEQARNHREKLSSQRKELSELVLALSSVTEKIAKKQVEIAETQCLYEATIEKIDGKNKEIKKHMDFFSTTATEIFSSLAMETKRSKRFNMNLAELFAVKEEDDE